MDSLITCIINACKGTIRKRLLSNIVLPNCAYCDHHFSACFIYIYILITETENQIYNKTIVLKAHDLVCFFKIKNCVIIIIYFKWSENTLFVSFVSDILDIFAHSYLY